MAVAQITYREDQIVQQIKTSYKQYLIAQKRKNTANINQSYARMEVWRSIFDEMDGNTNELDEQLDLIEIRINK